MWSLNEMEPQTQIGTALDLGRNGGLSQGQVWFHKKNEGCPKFVLNKFSWKCSIFFSLPDTTIKLSSKAVSRFTGGKIALKGAHGKFLVAERNGAANANRPWARSWETFQAVPQGGNKFAFKSHHNKYLVAERNGKLNANRPWIRSWEKFQVTCH